MEVFYSSDVECRINGVDKPVVLRFSGVFGVGSVATDWSEAQGELLSKIEVMARAELSRRELSVGANISPILTAFNVLPKFPSLGSASEPKGGGG